MRGVRLELCARLLGPLALLATTGAAVPKRDVLITREALEHSKLANHLHTVGNGEEALAFLRQEGRFAAATRPDLVLLDLMMPRLSGLDVLARMRGDERWREVPVIVLTAAGQEQHQRRSIELGANEFLTKPFSPKKLYARAADLARDPAGDQPAAPAAAAPDA